MPYNTQNFQPLSLAQVSPFGYAVQQGVQGIGQGVDLYKHLLDSQKMKFAIQQEQARQPYYGRLAQAEALKAEAEPNEINARTGLYGQQSSELEQKMKYFPEQFKSQQDLVRAQTEEQQALANQHKIDTQKTQKIMEYLNSDNNYPSTQNMVNSTNPSTNNNNQPNSAYGITVPTLTKEDIKNKVYFGMDTFSDKQKKAEERISEEKKKFDDLIADSVSKANTATKTKQALTMFNDAMNRSFYRGPSLGSAPSSGFASTFVPSMPFGQGLAPEQEADYAANQLLPGAIAQLTENMHVYRFSNLDMNMSQKFKFYRGMDDKTRELGTNWVNATESRMEEKPKFATALNRKVDANTAELLWTNYQQNQSLVSKDGKRILNGNLNKWPIYTTPAAIESVRTTGSYTPSKAMLDAVWMKLPDNTIIPVKPNKVKEAIVKLRATTL